MSLYCAGQSGPGRMTTVCLVFMCCRLSPSWRKLHRFVALHVQQAGGAGRAGRRAVRLLAALQSQLHQHGTHVMPRCRRAVRQGVCTIIAQCGVGVPGIPGASAVSGKCLYLSWNTSFATWESRQLLEFAHSFLFRGVQKSVCTQGTQNHLHLLKRRTNITERRCGVTIGRTVDKKKFDQNVIDRFACFSVLDQTCVFLGDQLSIEGCSLPAMQSWLSKVAESDGKHNCETSKHRSQCPYFRAHLLVKTTSNVHAKKLQNKRRAQKLLVSLCFCFLKF